MGRAEQGFEALLEAESLVPEHVAQAGQRECEGAVKRGHIAAGQGAPPVIAAADIAEMQDDQGERGDPVGAVEDGVPGCEKGIVDATVIMRPAVDIESEDHHAGDDGYPPIQAQIICRHVS